MSAAARLARRSLPVPELSEEWRRRLIAAVIALVGVLTTYLVWFRDLSLWQIEKVTVTGLTSADARGIRAALEAEATEMTTLHVRRDRLERAVEGYPVVRGLDVSPDFPSGVRIHVLEQRPAAFLASGRSRVAAAADGSVLEGVPVKAGQLPVVPAPVASPSDKVQHPGTLALLRVAGGAPALLQKRLGQVERDGVRGIVVTIEDGPELIFGAPTQVHEKWAAATRVLADEASRGASYVDLRLPDRPAAGGLSVDTIEPTDPAITYSQP